jgi:hypothetical protein
VYFQHEIDRINRRKREQVRAGLIALAIAISVVIELIAVTEVAERQVTGTGLRCTSSSGPSMTATDPGEPGQQPRDEKNSTNARGFQTTERIAGAADCACHQTHALAPRLGGRGGLGRDPER